MEEEKDEDTLLLNRLGVTSANPEDLERAIVTEVNRDFGFENDFCKNPEDLIDNKHQEDNQTSSTQVKLRNKLRALELEIDAVASTVGQRKNISSDENSSSKSTNHEEEDTDGLSLQQALAKDRLRCLKNAKTHLKRELALLNESVHTEDVTNKEFLDELVKEESNLKKRKNSQHNQAISTKHKKKFEFSDDTDFDAVLDAASAGFVETAKEELIRKGVLTPFHRLKGFERRLQQPGPSNWNNSSQENTDDDFTTRIVTKTAQSISEAAQSRPTTKLLDVEFLPKLEAPTIPFFRLKTPLKLHESLVHDDPKKLKCKINRKKRPLPEKKWRKITSREDEISNVTEEDTNDELAVSDFESEDDKVDQTDDPSYVTLEGGLKIPCVIFNKLFDYQKVGVQWLWELHCQRAGGIIGDEMGLGKTIQVISFLGSLHFSKMYKPSIVICPVTLLRQWRREVHRWYPNFHVEILHDSVQVPVSRKKLAKSTSDSDDESEELSKSDNEGLSRKSSKKWDALIDRVLQSESGLLITTYEQLKLLGDKLLDIEWGCAVLDEGHRIRNPNAEITLVCKQLQTVHRIIMTGAPIQNKLTELWSLFDFVFPGKLGVLPVFETEFAVPIAVGGYANASPLQVSTAYRCAVVLRDLIMPYLLRRMKTDVNAHLPKKTEHVLFCSLTEEQRSIYRAFLASSEVEQIFDGRKNSLYGIDVMKKICNHPDLLEREHSYGEDDYGNPNRSGKMNVLDQILKVWKEQGHRVLLFTQTQQMLDILEKFLVADGYTYRRMDGITPVKQRMTLIDEFNNSEHIFIFILTTRVGGIGTNLIGANRVIIYDPDWNPSTDMQARERAWRIGQTRDVTVYRLITRGTIEEKVYHRQIYKHFLTNKILKNPQQKRFFKARDMKDLFTLHDDEGDGGSTETSNIFRQLSGDVNVGIQKENEPSGSKTNKKFKMVQPSIKLTNNRGKEKDDQGDEMIDVEADILKNLFDAHGIHSAMDHDVIINASDEDKIKLEEQASQVAQRAAEALRQSRLLRSRDSISVPTWTGKSGTAGAPLSLQKKFGSTTNTRILSTSTHSESSSNGISNKTSGFAAGVSTGKALSSTDLLAKIRLRQDRAIGDGLDHGLSPSLNHQNQALVNEGPSSSRPSQKKILVVQPEVLIRQLCTFIQQRGGSTSSSSIVEHFKDRIPSKDLSLFKNLLKEIATLEKHENGSIWILKPDYQEE